MTLDEYLKTVEEREQRATEGPWWAKQPEVGTMESPEIRIPSGGVLVRFTHYGNMREDAELAAHSRTDIPKLLRIIRTLREGLEQACTCYKRELPRLSGHCHACQDLAAAERIADE